MGRLARWMAVLCLGVLASGCAELGTSDERGSPAGSGGAAASGGNTGGSSGAGSTSAGGSSSSAGAGSTSPVTPDGAGLFVTLPETGSVDVTLHASDGAPLGTPTLVAFGVPFPRGVVADAGELRVLDASGGEIPSHVEELVRWHSLGDQQSASSLRAALVYVEPTLDSDTLALQIEWGATRTLELGPQPPARSTWVAVSDDYPASAGVEEPAVYATFSPEWLSACLLRSRTTTLHADPAWKWFDDSFDGSGHTAVNDVDPGVTSLIDYVSDPEPWLFDRSMTLFGLYVRSGDVNWLRHAHRSTQFYAAHLDASGNFDLKGSDLKYAYGQSLLVDLMLTGDVDLVDPIERVADNAASWTPSYQPSANFWTERHQTYALLGALSAFEATGDAAHAERARSVAKASFDLARKPPVSSWQNDGCMLHEFDDHEGAGGSAPVCSPWMSALFADAVFRYYIHSEDPEALEFLIGLAEYVQKLGVYSDTIDGEMRVVPWYLSSSEVQFSDSGPYADIEHACDVAGIVARGAWAAKLSGKDASELSTTAGELIASCQVNLESWYRPNGPQSGLSVWRITPARKFNWWFGSTLDLAWLLEATN